MNRIIRHLLQAWLDSDDDELDDSGRGLVSEDWAAAAWADLTAAERQIFGDVEGLRGALNDALVTEWAETIRRED